MKMPRRRPGQILEADVTQRRGNFFGIVNLRRRAFGHGSAGIDQQVNVHLIGGKDLQQQPIEPPVNIPVDIAEIIALLVSPVVGELEAEASSG